jgi:hypothetical protein
MLDVQEVEDFPYPSPPTNPCLNKLETRYWVSKYGYNSVRPFTDNQQDYFILHDRLLRGYRFKTLHCVGLGWADFPSEIDISRLKVFGCQEIVFHSLAHGVEQRVSVLI